MEIRAEEYIELDAIEPYLESDSYRESLKRLASSLKSKIDSNATEATVASIFETEIYYFMRTALSFDPVFEREISGTSLRHAFKGRMDCVVNGLVIEYKRPGRLSGDGDIAEAVSQLSDYLKQLATIDSEPEGMLTDGMKVKFFYWQDSELHSTGFSSIGRQVLDFIIRGIIGAGRKSFSAANVVSDFSLSTKLNPTYELSQLLFNALVENPSQRTNMLYEEWLALFHLSENDSGKNKDISNRRRVLSDYFDVDINDNDLDYRALYALQTCYAVVVKLFACKSIGMFFIDEAEGSEHFNDFSLADPDRLQRFLMGLEDGRIYRDRGVRNLLEDDFFSWYCSPTQWDRRFAEPIREIISQIRLYAENISSIRTASVDIFKDLYMDFIPQEVRHSLGEYYTDSWLADCVTRKAVDMSGCPDSWRGIDPCCGSGVFLLSMISLVIGQRDVRAMSDDDRSGLLHDILQRVSGIDINPLSALTARVNYFLAVKDLIGEDDEVEIPVYVGDSAAIPQTVDLDGVKCFAYSINTQKKPINIVLPCSFVASGDFLLSMDRLQTCIQTGDVRLSYETLVGNIDSGSLNDLVRERIEQLCEQLVMLHENDWDGIWVRVAANFMLVARISERDIIVGNPPWVKWEFLPEQYALKLKESCLERHLFSGQSYMGAISLNVCAPIANMTASAWLTRGGVLGFIMPTNLLTQDSYEGFRHFLTPESTQGERLYLQKVDLWDKAGKLFGKASNEPCATYFYKFDEIDYIEDGFSVTRYRKNDRADLSGMKFWSDARDHLAKDELLGIQLDLGRSGYTIIPVERVGLTKKFRAIAGASAYRGRTGVEFVPEEVTELRGVKPARGGVHYFGRIKKKAAIHKASSYGEVLLETEYIRPLLTGPEIKPFNIDWKGNYCLFPYSDGETECVSIDRLSRSAPKTAQYLLDNRVLFSRQSERSKQYLRGSEFYALSKIGAYTFAENMVVIRDNTTMCASVVHPLMTDWGVEMMPVPAKHAAIISTRSGKDEALISADEAYYLAGVFNTGLIRDYFKLTFSGRSYSIKFHFCIPLYDSSDGKFVRISEASKECHILARRGDDYSALVMEIEDLYLELCKNYNQ